MKDPFELSADVKPRKVKRELRERDIQKACVDYARKKGFWARKFSSPSQRSVPDYLFAKRYPGKGIVFAVEFKAPGKNPTAAQNKEHEAMNNAGWIVWASIGRNGEEDIATFKERIDCLDRIYG
jgi:hypothetical protein